MIYLQNIMKYNMNILFTPVLPLIDISRLSLFSVFEVLDIYMKRVALVSAELCRNSLLA